MPDINIPFPVGWVNVYAALGVTVGTQLIIQNKDSGYDPLMREQATIPVSGDSTGAIAPYGQQYSVPSGATGCFIRGRLSGVDGGPGVNVNVQVAP